MTSKHHLTEQLERAAASIDVGAPPVDAMVDTAARTRRKRRATAAAAFSTLVIVAGGIGLAVYDTGAPQPSVAGEDRAVTDVDPGTVKIFVPDPATEQRDGECSRWSGLRAETVAISATGDRAREAVQALVLAPAPEGHVGGGFARQDGRYTVRSVVHTDGVIAVDLDKDPWDPFPNAFLTCAPDGELVMQQIVRTVQNALGSDDPVLLTVNGVPARGIWMHPLNGPIDSTESQTATGALDGTWDVVGLIDEDAESVLPAKLRGKVSLTFDNDNLSGFTGCNMMQGTYIHHRKGGQGQWLRLEISTVTRGVCDVEAPLVERLKTVRFTTVADGYRYLHDENWMIVAQLEQR